MRAALAIIQPAAVRTASPRTNFRLALIGSAFVAAWTFLPCALALGLLHGVGLLEQEIQFRLPDWHLPNPRLNLLAGFVGVIWLSPLVESALILLLVRLGRGIRIPPTWIPFLSGLVWALLHARNGNWAYLIAFWPFFVFTIQWLREEPHGLDRAWLLVTLSHSIHNTLALLLAWTVEKF